MGQRKDYLNLWLNQEIQDKWPLLPILHLTILSSNCNYPPAASLMCPTLTSCGDTGWPGSSSSQNYGKISVLQPWVGEERWYNQHLGSQPQTDFIQRRTSCGPNMEHQWGCRYGGSCGGGGVGLGEGGRNTWRNPIFHDYRNTPRENLLIGRYDLSPNYSSPGGCPMVSANRECVFRRASLWAGPAPNSSQTQPLPGGPGLPL